MKNNNKKKSQEKKKKDNLYFLKKISKRLKSIYSKILRPSPKGRRWQLLIILLVGVFLTLNFVHTEYWNKTADYLNEKQDLVELPWFYEKKFLFGLDLAGGIELTYRANFEQVADEQKEDGKKEENLSAIKEVIEERVNLYGVSEAEVRTVNIGEEKGIIVSLPGIKDKEQAIETIGKTPSIDFREEKNEEEMQEMLNEFNANVEDQNSMITEETLALYGLNYKETELTGKYIKSAGVGYDQISSEPEVLLQFNSEGKELFADLTERNIGKRIGIFLDGQLRSAPVVQDKINSDQASISGMTEEEAYELKDRLNAGALPVEIELVSERSVEATIGAEILDKLKYASFIAGILVIILMLIIYRYPGFLASISLLTYAILLLASIKWLGVTLTLSGLAGIIFSLGIAIDANVLIFERVKEELKKGREISMAIEEGFLKSWESIRDSNISTLIICGVLLLVSGVPIMRGFAVTLGLGVIISFFSAIVVTRILLRQFASGIKNKKVIKYLFK